MRAPERPIILDLAGDELAQLDDWIAAGSSPEQSRAEAVREILLTALELRGRRKMQADRLSSADNAFAAHLRSKGFLPE